jgi:hypothetical protein
MRRRPSLAVFALLVLVAASPSAPASAQEADHDGPWSWTSELGASLFFGAADQTALTLGGSAERTSEWLELSLGGAFAYGEAQNPDTRESFVNKRSWNAASSLDYRPQARVSPFVFVSGEGGLERQIDLRLSGGAGAKYHIVRSERSRLDASLAALVERTDPRVQAGEPDEIDTKGRWSARLRAGRTFAEGRTTFNLVGFYRPAFEDTGDYTIELESSLAFALNQTVALKISVLDRYDSLAEDRGAASNNDGRLFVSVVASGN